MRRIALPITILALVTLVVAARSRAEHGQPIAPRPCVVGTPGCGPLPTMPTGTPKMSAHELGVPRPGLLRPGAYDSLGFTGLGFHRHFSVPAGWSWNGQTLSKGNAAISFYIHPVLVYGDPCHWDRRQHLIVKPGQADGNVILSELAAQPMRYATRVNGLPDGYMAIRLTVPSNLDVSRCDHGQYRTWGGANTLLAQGPGQRDLIWIQYAGNGTFIVDATTFPNTPRPLVHEVDAILASVGACTCG